MDTATVLPTRLFAEASGQTGPTVVLLHGVSEDRRSFEPLTRQLSRRHQVLSIDLPGHGLSADTDDYSAHAMAMSVINRIEDLRERPHLVGHSLGGLVATFIGARYPVASVVNIDQNLQLASFKAQLQNLESTLRGPNFEIVMGQLFQSLEGPLPDAERQRLKRIREFKQTVMLNQGETGVWDALLTLDEGEISTIVDQALGGYQKSPCPYLTVMSSAPEGYSEWLRERIPGAQLQFAEGQGHYPHLTDPAGFAERLEAFWAK